MAFLLLLAGCGEVASPTYAGDSLAILRGVVLNPEGLQLQSDVAAHVVWSSTSNSQVAASTTFEARLPADFTLAIYNPPPAAAVESDEGVFQARGDVYVLTPNQLTALSNGDPVLGPYGRTQLFTLLWFPSSADADDEQARRQLTRPLQQGFNLLARSEDDAAVAAGCDVCSDGFNPVPLATVIALALTQDAS